MRAPRWVTQNLRSPTLCVPPQELVQSMHPNGTMRFFPGGTAELLSPNHGGAHAARPSFPAIAAFPLAILVARVWVWV